MLKKYFLEDAEKDLTEEIKQPDYDENFHMLYLQTIAAFNEKKSLDEILMNNSRTYSIVETNLDELKSLTYANALNLLQIPFQIDNSEAPYVLEKNNSNLFKYCF